MKDNKKTDNIEEIPESRYEKVSYWEVAWGQIKKNKVALFGLWCITLFILIAVFAPLISMSRPFYFSAPKGYELDNNTILSLTDKIPPEKLEALKAIKSEEWQEITEKNSGIDIDIATLEPFLNKKISKEELTGELIKAGFKAGEIDDIISRTGNNKFTKEGLSALLSDASFNESEINTILNRARVKTSYPFL